jgi:hypothetical protein
MNVRKKITGKPKRFPKATQDLAEKDGEGRVVIYERAGIRKKYLSEIPVTQAVDVAANIESVLAESFGGGIYEVNLVSRDSEVKGRYSYDIAGNPKGRRQTPSEDQQPRSGKKSASDEAFVAVLGKLAEAAIGQRTSSAEEWERSLKLIKELKGEDGEYRQMVTQMLSGIVQNALTQQPMDIENALQIIQLSKELGPTLHQEDSMSSLINLVVPFLLQGLGAKGTGGQPELTPEQMQMVQAYLQQLQAGTAGQPLPPGQASQTQAALSSPQATQQVRQAPAQAKPPQEEKTGSEEDQIAFYRMFIEKFRTRITEGASDLELAKKIIVMLEYSVDYMRDDPHPWMIGILTNMNNPGGFATELVKFFEKIPELVGKSEHQEAIRQAMIALYTGQVRDDTDDRDTEDSDSLIQEPEVAEAGAAVDS